MRPVSELIEEVRFYANIEKSSRFTDERMVLLFDAAQRQIQMVIFNAYPQDQIFSDVKRYSRNDEQRYKLPLNKMLTPNSIHALLALSNTGTYSDPLPRVNVLERQKTRGYYLQDGFINLTNTFGQSSADAGIELVYAKILPRLVATTQVSELPTICEEFMVQWVHRKVDYINSSKDVANSQVFTQQQRSDIASLFADAARDPKYPTILNDEYMAF